MIIVTTFGTTIPWFTFTLVRGTALKMAFKVYRKHKKANYMKADEFNILKTQAKEGFENFIKALNGFAFESITHPHEIQQLLKLYDQAIKSGSNFINTALLYPEE
jgi:hypothetical protein